MMRQINAPMIRTPLLGLSIVFLTSQACSQSHARITTSFDYREISDFNTEFKKYCNPGENNELNAVTSSMVGDYVSAQHYASLANRPTLTPRMPGDLADKVRHHYKSHCENQSLTTAERESACKVLPRLARPTTVEDLFKTYRMLEATTVIAQQAVGRKIVLINEAHYSSQHRSFTTSLLKLFWDQGFRYLAIETLNAEDSAINVRRYPVKNSGYYSNELAYAKLIREAISLGYKLVAYDVHVNDQNKRDSLQAVNIIQKTFNLDPAARVLVHAGYSHIAESGDKKFKPMGFMLKKLSGFDPLSIDQTVMMPYDELEKQHPYYTHVASTNKLNVPKIAINDNEEVLVDPVNFIGVDIQVYHPPIFNIKNRPGHLITNGDSLIRLPDQFLMWPKHLLEVRRSDEQGSSVSVDRVIIGTASYLILKPSEYKVFIINSSGTLIATCCIRVK